MLLFKHAIISAILQHNDLLLSVIEYGNNVPKHITKVIVSGDLPGEILVSSTPQYVEHNATFLVDTSYLANWQDPKTDLTMKRCATKTYYFQKDYARFS